MDFVVSQRHGEAFPAHRTSRANALGDGLALESIVLTLRGIWWEERVAVRPSARGPGGPFHDGD